jgi:hypothetical protein
MSLNEYSNEISPYKTPNTYSNASFLTDEEQKQQRELS